MVQERNGREGTYGYNKGRSEHAEIEKVIQEEGRRHCRNQVISRPNGPLSMRHLELMSTFPGGTGSGPGQKMCRLEGCHAEKYCPSDDFETQWRREKQP